MKNNKCLDYANEKLKEIYKKLTDTIDKSFNQDQSKDLRSFLEYLKARK